MPMQIHIAFENPNRQINFELGQAKKEIILAACNLPEYKTFRLLCQKAATGLSVKLIWFLDNRDDIKRSALYQKLLDCGGKIYQIPLQGYATYPQSVYILDKKTVITGHLPSNSSDSGPNVLVVYGAPNFAEQYLLIVNEFLNTARHLNRQSRGYLKIPANPLKKHIPTVITYLHPQLRLFRQELIALSFEVKQVQKQKAVDEKLIFDFSNEHKKHLGPLIKKVLQLQVRLARQRMYTISQQGSTEQKYLNQAKEEYEQAQKDYHEHRYQNQPSTTEPRLSKISLSQEATLKSLFRKASMQCHPDRVDKANKDRATKTFRRLINAYRNRNLEEVKQISEELATENFLNQKLNQCSQRSQLIKDVLQLRLKVRDAYSELRSLHQTLSWQIQEQAGDWVIYFDEQADLLNKEIENIQLQLGTLDE